MTEYMTTKELADFLRIKQRKVYDLAASGRIPCSRAMGKLLFPRAEIEAWVARGMVGDGATAAATPLAAAPARARPGVFLGSHDPLLDWALRQSRCGLATFFDGSADGLARFAEFEGVAAGLHMFNPEAGNSDDDAAWNIGWARRYAAAAPCVLVEFAWRDRGLVIDPTTADRFTAITDLRGRLIVPRQAEAGSQALLEHLLAEAGIGPDDCVMTEPARTETDAAEVVASHMGEVTLGLRPSAAQFKLAFVPILRERFDLLVDRKAWFEPPMQAFLAFCRSEEFRFKAQTMGGYDISGLGRVHFVGA
ncbi:MAG: excisionase [Rhodospirillaceae bacterium]|nr:excisionase [Magnetovibrio sp.]MAY66896.1 excisionase [Rhodospirillaceae bacterium]